MKTDYKPGDKVVVIKAFAGYADPSRAIGSVLTVKYLNTNPDHCSWQVFFEETLGLDFKHIRPLTLLEKELLE